MNSEKVKKMKKVKGEMEGWTGENSDLRKNTPITRRAVGLKTKGEQVKRWTGENSDLRKNVELLRYLRHAKTNQQLM